jgi:nifR3 family TIM-barrel protein
MGNTLSKETLAAPLVIRGLAIDPPLLSAPMAGLTHSPFRRLLLGFGGVGALCTEMLAACGLHAERPDSPFLLRTPEESPLFYQLLASNPEEVARGVEVVCRLGADGVDLNFGCPAPAVRKRGGGSRLMQAPDRAAQVVRRAREGTNLPLSAKIRLGERLEEEPLRDFCRMLEAEGVDMITVHARLRGEPYGRRPRWDWIGKVKSWVSVPVVGNGGIFSPQDAQACLAASGCDGLMIGRGCVVRPWLLRDIAREVYGLPLSGAQPNRAAVYGRFLELLGEALAKPHGFLRLKEFTHYFSRTYAFGHTLAMRVQSATSPEEAVERAEAFFRASEPDFAPWELTR